VPDVRRKTYYPRMTFIERIRLGDDALPRDAWAALVDEQADLLTALRITDAIARNDQGACRDLAGSVLGESTEFWTGAPDRFDPDYGRSYRTPRWTDEDRVPLFARRFSEVDWVELARQALAGLIRRQIDFAVPSVFWADGMYVVGWRPTSLIEAMYLELLEHLRRRPAFGVSFCERCGGPILRTRKPGPTGNRWHRRCQAGRMERWRSRIGTGDERP
jgi:hypothetical protein